MKYLAGWVGLFAALTALAGCSETPRARTPDEVFGAMSRELAQSLDHGPGDDGLAVGTTTLTQASLTDLDRPVLPTSMPLPDERMSLSGLDPAAGRTSGPSEGDHRDEMPATREAE